MRHVASATARPDVAVIGGGIIGTATAYELARSGCTVRLFESGAIAGLQSGRNWGFVRQQGRSRAELPLMRDANLRWQRLEEKLAVPVGWVRGGNLALAGSAAGAEAYREWVALGRSHGIDTRMVDAETVETIVPKLRLPFVAAIYAKDDGHADPRRATAAFADAARHDGTVISTSTPVASLTWSGSRVTGLVTADGAVVSAGVTICAAGAASRRLLGPLGLGLPQATVRGTVAMTGPVRPVTRATVWADGLSFRQRADGRLVVSTGGGGEVDLTWDALRQSRWFLPSFRRNYRRLRPRVGVSLFTGRPTTLRPTPARVRRSIARLHEALPDLGAVEVEHAWAGLIDSTPDALPIIDAPVAWPGLVVATGFSGHGFGLAPAVGATVAALARAEPPPHDVHPFRIARFAEGDFCPPDAVL
ncbi:MAG: FAD-dependent oxidoreductase [Streptosporangiales bacterium]|nr:FAD-dependent oxidoreductase [Streptosporangiales bacterium]